MSTERIDPWADSAARRKAQNPWTEADEIRRAAKSAAENAAHAKWVAANPKQDEQNEEADDADEQN